MTKQRSLSYTALHSTVSNCDNFENDIEVDDRCSVRNVGSIETVRIPICTSSFIELEVELSSNNYDIVQ